MSIYEFTLILWDSYKMDVWMPPLFGEWKKYYKRVSYQQWAIDELKDFIAEQLFPRTEAPLDEFCELTCKFMKKMTRYAKVNPKTSVIFSAAGEMAADVLDLLYAMKGV